MVRSADDAMMTPSGYSMLDSVGVVGPAVVVKIMIM